MKPIFLFYLLSIFLSGMSVCLEQTVKNDATALELNFDELEEQALQAHALNNVEHKPLHPLLVLMRVVGSPLVNAYFTLTKKASIIWQRLLQVFEKKGYHEYRARHA